MSLAEAHSTKRPHNDAGSGLMAKKMNRFKGFACFGCPHIHGQASIAGDTLLCEPRLSDGYHNPVVSCPHRNASS
jgi:hypothetical protein